ncbi:MAG TPA: hypothetical protein VHH36_01725 [Candidatus Thermoplasmatota archaeon]|nr:hypothetical protein [Candidatus Thermoplasmatota archaeon]
MRIALLMIGLALVATAADAGSPVKARGTRSLPFDPIHVAAGYCIDSNAPWNVHRCECQACREREYAIIS